MVAISSFGNTRNRLMRNWRPGVRGRLLLAFLGITTFAVMAGIVGVYAFRQVGNHLDIIDSRVPPTLSAFELSRSAERIISAAPTLLSATDTVQQDEAEKEIMTEVVKLQTELSRLRNGNIKFFSNFTNVDPAE